VTYLFGATPASTDAGALPERALPERVLSEGTLSEGTLSDGTLSDGTLSDGTLSDGSDDSPSERRGGFTSISDISMHALARRSMSAQEMIAYLLSRDFEDGEVELECDRLLRVGLLDDLALAETLVRTLTDRKGLGRGSIVAELRRRKVDSTAIEEAVEKLEAGDELDRAIAIAQKRAPQLRSLDAVTARRRLGAFLQRRGYSGSVISTAVARALEPTGPVFR